MSGSRKFSPTTSFAGKGALLRRSKAFSLKSSPPLFFGYNYPLALVMAEVQLSPRESQGSAPNQWPLPGFFFIVRADCRRINLFFQLMPCRKRFSGGSPATGHFLSHLKTAFVAIDGWALVRSATFGTSSLYRDAESGFYRRPTSHFILLFFFGFIFPSSIVC
jgi:hypothetical protein